jgi:hypothetical protein
MVEIFQTSQTKKLALRLLVAEYFISCKELDPCWYRVNSREGIMLPGGKTKALLPSVADFFGMNDKTKALLPSVANFFGMTDKRANDLLLGS